MLISMTQFSSLFDAVALDEAVLLLSRQVARFVMFAKNKILGLKKNCIDSGSQSSKKQSKNDAAWAIYGLHLNSVWMD
jgi:hypothetical protein